MLPITLFRTPQFKPAKVGILGVPFESTATFASGTKFAPYYIRIAGENTEEYSTIQKKNVLELSISDWGNVDVFHGNFEGTRRQIIYDMSKMKEAGVERFFVIGGEHSITPVLVEFLKPKKVAVLDAHLDFEEEWLGIKHSHACATRRVSEIVGIENVAVFGARSFSQAEERDAKELGLEFYTSFEIFEDPKILLKLKKFDYISIDMDVFDPSFAPEVGNPEPFGLNPWEVIKYLTKAKAEHADLVEAAPKSGTSSTAALANALAREVLIMLAGDGHD